MKNRLINEGYKAETLDFHVYTSPTGQLIQKWLSKEWECDQKSIELIMAADKQAQQEWFKQLEKQGCDFLILDRYLLSQAVYGVASGSDSKWIVELQRYMRKPDIDIVIDIPAEESMRRRGKHNGGVNDRYEENLELLKKVREYYKTFSTSFSAPQRYVVDGMRTVEEIHEDIYQIVKPIKEVSA